MEFFEYLVKNYGYNEVIIGAEISFEGYSRPWIAKKLSGLCDEIKIIHDNVDTIYTPPFPYNLIL